MRLFLIAILLLLCAVVSCGSDTSLIDEQASEQAIETSRESSWDPFAAPIEVVPQNEAVRQHGAIEIEGMKLIALDSRNNVDPFVLESIDVKMSGSVLTVQSTVELGSASLYLTYDASSHFAAETELYEKGAIGLAMHSERGVLAIGVAAVNNGSIPAGSVLASVKFTDGRAPEMRSLSDIAQTPRNAVDDLRVTDNTDDIAILAWSERHNGDYDQNGLVNISDLTPLAANFNASFTTESADFARLEVVDGDENLNITIADLTPIAASFGSAITGYNVYRTELNTPDEIPDPADTGRWTQVTGTGTDGRSVDREYTGQDFRLPYTFQDDSGAGEFGWYVAPTGNPGDAQLEGPVSNVITSEVEPSGPPPANLDFEIQAPATNSAVVGDEFYVAITVANVSNLFSANVRFEYDNTILELLEAVPAYDTNLNFLEPPLFLSVDGLGTPVGDYTLVGFNATQTQGIGVKSGSGALGYFKFKAIAQGSNADALRFPQASNFMLLWGEQYGVPIATPVVGGGELLNVAPAP